MKKNLYIVMLLLVASFYGAYAKHKRFCDNLEESQYNKRQTELSKLLDECGGFASFCLPYIMAANEIMIEEDHEALVKENCAKDTQ